MFSEFMEICIFAAIAGFLVFKLYITLGQKTGYERPQDANSTDPYGLNKSPEPSVKPAVEEVIDTTLDPLLKENLEKIKSFDPGFTIADFLKKATQAFEIILDAFAKDDLATLKMMLGTSLYAEFETTIKERQQNQETLETTLVKVESVHLSAIELQGSTARITVDFQTEQLHVTRNSAGDIIDGNPKQIEQLYDSWMFERDLSHRNPTWILVTTAS